MLTKEQIQKAGPIRKSITVDVPEWGGVVRVRELTAGLRDEFDQILARLGTDDAESRDRVRARLVAKTLCDEKGGLLFSDEDVDTLNSYGSIAMDRIFEAVVDLHGMMSRRGGKHRAIDDAAKNSDSVPNG